MVLETALCWYGRGEVFFVIAIGIVIGIGFSKVFDPDPDFDDKTDWDSAGL